MKEFNLTADQRKVAAGAAKSEERPVLACVHLTKDRIESADGHVLIQKQVDYDGENMLLNAKDIAKQKGLFKDGVVSYQEQDNGDIKCIGKDITIIAPVEGTFPDTDKLWPKELGYQEVFQIALSPDRLQDVINSLDKNCDMIKFHFYGHDKPVEFHAGETTKGLVMPMFVQW